MTSGLRQFLPEFHSRADREGSTQGIEQDAAALLAKLRNDTPSSAAKDAAGDCLSLLVRIERWKADCAGERTGNARTNAPIDVLVSFREAATAKSDSDAFAAVMTLRGFGTTPDADTGERPAKTASAVLRFLNPDRWGTVDWRTLAMRDLFNKEGNWDTAWLAGKKIRASMLRDAYRSVGVRLACDMQEWYRELAAPERLRVADVDMAIFALSLRAWPFPKS